MKKNIHRWSGWPHAVCMKCGAEDQLEIGMADNCPDCLINCKCTDISNCGECWGTGVVPGDCKVHINGPCPVEDEKTTN